MSYILGISIVPPFDCPSSQDQLKVTSLPEAQIFLQGSDCNVRSVEV